LVRRCEGGTRHELTFVKRTAFGISGLTLIHSRYRSLSRNALVNHSARPIEATGMQTLLRGRLAPVSENNPTRREVLQGMAAMFLLDGALGAQDTASSLCFTSAVEMAKLIRTKQLSARETLTAHLKQIGRINPTVNAIVTLVPEMAADAAAKADDMQAHNETLGPLHGLPVAHKDLLETRGIRTTFGSPLYKDYIATEDDIVVDRMRRAGAITIGKTNTPEFGAGSQTFNKVFALPWRWRADLCRSRVAPIPAGPCAIPRHSAT
jgi:hypothetical protein